MLIEGLVVRIERVGKVVEACRHGTILIVPVMRITYQKFLLKAHELINET